MKFLGIWGLAALTATALLVFATSASATSLTSPAGTPYTGSVKAKHIGNVHVHYGSSREYCASNAEWKGESHGPAVTAKGPVTSFSVYECGSKITMLKLGSFETHTHPENATNGVITWTGAEMTAEIVGMDCVYKLEKPLVAWITSGSTAGLDFEARWVYAGQSWFCPKTSIWTAEYLITSPDYLSVD